MWITHAAAHSQNRVYTKQLYYRIYTLYIAVS